MFTAREYVRPNSIDEAWEILNAKKPNTIVSGNHFLKMGRKVIATAIDMQNLKLNEIKEDGENIFIGASVSLRQVEESDLLKKYFGDVFEKAFFGIVGTQFRNTATIGGSVHARYGFSDPCLVFLVLDAKVCLYNEEISMEEYLSRPVSKDMVLGVKIPMKEKKVSYQCVRKSATDISVLNVCAANSEEGIKIAVGSRPKRAALAYKAMNAYLEGKDSSEIGKIASEELVFGSNLRGSSEYRAHLAKVLVKRAVEEVR